MVLYDDCRVGRGNGGSRWGDLGKLEIGIGSKDGIFIRGSGAWDGVFCVGFIQT